MQIVDFAAEHRLPSIYGFRAFADVGGLMSYGPSLSDLWQRAAGYVDRILKGAKPSELAVEQPTRFEFIINMMAATALGITVPTTLLASADVLID